MRKGIRGLFGATVTVALVTGLQAASAGAATTPKNLTCDGEVVLGTVKNVTVPKGKACTLSGTTVTGSISIDGGGNQLNLTRATVRGGIRTVNWNTMTSAARMTVQSSQVAGKVVVDNTRATYTSSRLGGLTTGGFIGDDTILTLTRVTGDVDSGGRYTSIEVTHSTVDGSFSGSWAGTRVTSSHLNGKNTLGGLGVTLCGSTFGPTTLDGSGTIGDNAKCRGNTFEKTLTVAENGRIATFYDNTVVGRATSPKTQPDAPKGARNVFRGGVTGILAKLK